MLQLPDDPRLDQWRDSGWNQSENQAATDTLPVGTTSFLQMMQTWQRWQLSDRRLYGAVGDFGYPKSVLLIEKSMYAALGKGTNGGSYGYSWADAFLRGFNVIGRDFIVQFEDDPSPSHFNGRGKNAFDLRNSLLINVHGVNCDCFVFLRGQHSEARDCSASVADTDFDGLERTGVSAHYAFKSTADQAAFVRCRVPNTMFQHDFSVEQAAQTAFVDCWGVNPTLDHHANKTMNEWTLWYRMFVGSGTRLKNYGGNPIYLPHAHRSSYFVDVRYGRPTGPGHLVPAAAFHATGPDRQVFSVAPPPPPPPTVSFQVKTTAFVNVRQEPRKASALVGTQSSGKLGLSSWEPISDTAEGIEYILVNFDSGADGYVDMAKLVKL